ncbi:hypothetical protein [Erwinia sp.]|uniref:hypothetical protein n=1 Tax=Erwinia citreus TaxID=558 RepID=UPI003C70AB32
MNSAYRCFDNKTIALQKNSLPGQTAFLSAFGQCICRQVAIGGSALRAWYSVKPEIRGLPANFSTVMVRPSTHKNSQGFTLYLDSGNDFQRLCINTGFDLICPLVSFSLTDCGVKDNSAP